MGRPGTVALFINRPVTAVLMWIKTQPGLSEAQIEALDSAIAMLKAIDVPNNNKALLGETPTKQPDVVRVRTADSGSKWPYQIDITEVVSPPGQTVELLGGRIDTFFNLIPPGLAGRGQAVPPK
jgi:hypothetical protein